MWPSERDVYPVSISNYTVRPIRDTQQASECMCLLAASRHGSLAQTRIYLELVPSWQFFPFFTVKQRPVSRKVCLVLLSGGHALGHFLKLRTHLLYIQLYASGCCRTSQALYGTVYCLATAMPATLAATLPAPASSASAAYTERAPTVLTEAAMVSGSVFITAH